MLKYGEVIIMEKSMVDKITDKEIQYNIMICLMKMEGHMSDMLNAQTPVEMMEGGEINDLAGTDKSN